MNQVSTVLIAFLTAALTACAAKPVADTYYSLVLAADDAPAVTAIDGKGTKVVVGPVEMPSYLSKRGLAMQSGPNQIRTANHHFWAEPLDAAIAKVLVRDISRLSGGLSVARDAGRWTVAANCRLRFEFDKFHATSRSSVVLSGRYWLSTDAAIISREFELTRSLSADGYSHAIAVLREALGMLAQSVTETLRENPRCSG